MLQTLKDRVEPLVESSVYLTRAGQWLMRKLPVLLPHHADYIGLQFFAPRESDGIFLDVGANCGLSALSFRRYFKTHPILSIEPFEYHSPALQEIGKRDPNFSFQIVGLSNFAGRRELVVGRKGNVYLHSIAFLDIDGKELERRKEKLTYYRQMAKQVKRVEVDLVTLDSLNVKPYFIKIDAEWHELPILEGARRTLERHRPFLLIENNPHLFESVCQLLKKIDYRPLFFDHGQMRFTQNSIRRNAYFIPAEMSENWLWK